MARILVVTGSVRPNSVNEKIVPLVVNAVEAKGQEVVVANLGELNLPFFDDPNSPTSPEFAPTHEAVKVWTDMVATADGVILVTPEYNHTLTPVQLNAIDWIGKEWDGKPVGLVGYGWTSGAGQAHATAREVLAVNLKAKVGDDQANLFFMKHISPSGEVIEQEAVAQKIDATVSELIEAISA